SLSTGVNEGFDVGTPIGPLGYESPRTPGDLLGMGIADHGQCLGRRSVVSWREDLERQRGVKALLQGFHWCREGVASAHNTHSITCVGTLGEVLDKTPFALFMLPTILIIVQIRRSSAHHQRPATCLPPHPEALSMAVDLAFLTIAEASALIKSRQLSPVQYVEALISRTETFDTQLHPYITPTFDLARQPAN